MVERPSSLVWVSLRLEAGKRGGWSGNERRPSGWREASRQELWQDRRNERVIRLREK